MKLPIVQIFFFVCVVLTTLFDTPMSQADDGRSHAHIVIIKTRENAFYNPAVDGLTHGLKVRGYDGQAGAQITIVALTGKDEADTQIIRTQIRSNPNLIVTLGTDATLRVFGQHTTIPVLFSMILDPVGLGLVNSLDNPGTNFSGTTMLVDPGKQFDALAQTAGHPRRIGVLYSSDDKTSLALIADARIDAKVLNMEVVSVPVSDPKHSPKNLLDDLRGKIDAFWIIPDVASTGMPALGDTLEFAHNEHLPVLGASGGNVRSGALLALYPNIKDMGDVTAEMAATLLDGNGQVSQMRVRGPRQTMLSVNLGVARDLGLSIPGTVLHLADDVIDGTANGK